MTIRTWVTVLAVAAIAAAGSIATADEDEATGAAVAKHMQSAKVTLQQGLTVADHGG